MWKQSEVVAVDDTILLGTKWIGRVTTPSESSLRSDCNFLVLLAAVQFDANPLSRGIERAYGGATLSGILYANKITILFDCRPRVRGNYSLKNEQWLPKRGSSKIYKATGYPGTFERGPWLPRGSTE